MKLSEMTINELKRELKTYESNLVISTEDLSQKYREVMAIDLKDPNDLDDVDQKESIKLSSAILTVEKKIASYKRYIAKIKRELESKRKELTKLVNYKIRNLF